LISLIDLIDLVRKRLLVTQIPAAEQIDDWSNVWFFADCHRDAPESSIRIPIFRFQCPDFRPTRRFVSADYYSWHEYERPDCQYAICPSLLPSIDTLVRVYLATKKDYSTTLGPFAGLDKAIRDFVEAYCIMPGTMPLVRPIRNVREVLLT
jgi:hypothetical protein